METARDADDQEAWISEYVLLCTALFVQSKNEVQNSLCCLFPTFECQRHNICNYSISRERIVTFLPACFAMIRKAR